MMLLPRALGCTALLLAATAAQADALQALREFGREVRSGKATFTQTVTSPDGAKKKTASGHFEFLRPNRFRFVYDKPFEQQIVADGQKVWLYDLDLNQVTVRPLAQALGATPAALLAGTALDKDFELSSQPDRDGLQWAQAVPRVKEGSIHNLRVGFEQKFGAWRLRQQLRVDNLGDKAYVGSVIANDTNGRFFEPAPGRQWGLGLTASYAF